MTETGKVRTFHIPPDPDLPAAPKPKKPELTKAEKEAMEQEAANMLAAKFAALNKEDYAGLAVSPRRRSREAALLIFFQMEMGSKDWTLAEKVFEDIGLSEECAFFARELARNAEADKECSIQLIGKHTREWTVDRLAAVDRCILFLAISEMLRDKKDNSAVILNEAIEMAKKFGDENSAPFVNGILDAIRRAEEQKPEEEE